MADQSLNMESVECHAVALFCRKWRISVTMILAQSSFKFMLAMEVSEELEINQFRIYHLISLVPTSSFLVL